MLWIALINKMGTGLWMGAAALYFTLVAGLSVAEVGMLLGVSGAVGIAGAPLAGHLADRFPVTRILIGAQLQQAVALLALLTTDDFALLLLYSAVNSLADRGANVLTKLYAARIAGRDRTRYQAVQRTVSNAGWAVGGLAGACALAVGTTHAYQALLLGNVVSFLAAAALTLRCAEPPSPSRVVSGSPTATPGSITATPGSPAAAPGSTTDASGATTAPGPASNPWRDRSFLLFTVTEAALFLDDAVLQVGIPLWIVHATDAPHGLAPLLMVLNCVLVVGCQVPLSRFGSTPERARALLVPLAVCFVVGCAALTVSALGGTGVAVAALTAAAIALTFAEILHAIASWELSIALAPGDAQGAYLGVHGLSSSAQRSGGPLLVTTVIAAGPLAWPVLGAGVIVTVAAQSRLVRRRLERQRAEVSRASDGRAVGVHPAG
ncbi:MFS transporter [Streptomyces venezuelae]|uniref:MFS transporter n=1 Tax=Streptomyces venezuelae TaxID=54571 RepID=A0A5P2BN35_STRVZ|nr:MFS transporter [Streptomyces venezuelae]QES31793.1 MFS transporter [Streptomyces venezuelae]